MSRTASHLIAASVVVLLSLGFMVIGAIRTTPDGPALPMVMAVLFSAVSAMATEFLRRRPAFQGSGAVRPILWAVVVGWGLMCHRLSGHPASLRSDHPIGTSVYFTLILTAPWIAYWTVFCLVHGRQRHRDASSEDLSGVR
jgi:hypothetical protein